MRGKAYTFSRRNIPPLVGHVGWGFELGDGTYFFGATEGKYFLPYISPRDDNGAWWGKESSFMAMADQMHKIWQYDLYKEHLVDDAHPAEAQQMGKAAKTWGYTVVLGNNCMDHVYKIIHAYGVPPRNLQWPQTNWAPNVWFDNNPGAAYPLR
ncbi:MAG: hypothetical protein WCE94_08445 [Candidatus Methanoperedens sp.]